MPVLAYLFANDGIAFVSRSVPQAIRNSIQQSVRKKRDRTFLAVAHNSQGRVLCSHDFEDMQAKKRTFLKSKTGVQILLAADVRALM